MNKKKTNLQKLTGGHPFNAERHLKWQLSSSYWKDSNDYLWRVGIIKENIPHESSAFFAKMYVDLLICAECALKSLIISLSKRTTTPEQEYLIARKNSHNLEKLYEKVERRAKRRIKLLSKKDKEILLKANSLGVGFRYDITTFLFLTQEDFVDREFNEGQVSSVINFNFIINFYEMLFNLKKIARKSIDKYYGKDNSISGKYLKKMTDRRDAFFIAMKNQL
jgi:hypothetical protein